MVAEAGEELVVDAAVKFDILSRLTYCGGVNCLSSTPIESRSIWASRRRQGEGESNVVADAAVGVGTVADAAVDAAVDATVDADRSASTIGDWFTAFPGEETNGESRDLFTFLPV